MNINKEYSSIMWRTMHVQADTSYHNTLCTVRDCYSNCHEQCSLEFLMDPDEIGRRCAIFDDNDRRVTNCTVCHHSFRDHRHFHSKWSVETKPETVTDDDAQKKYNEAQSTVHSIQFQQSRIKDAIKLFETKIREHEESLGKLCLEFQGVALSGSFAGHIASAIRLLEVRLATMKSNGTDSQGIKRMEDRIASLQQKLDIVERAKQAGHGAVPVVSVVAQRPQAVGTSKKSAWRRIALW